MTKLIIELSNNMDIAQVGTCIEFMDTANIVGRMLITLGCIAMVFILVIFLCYLLGCAYYWRRTMKPIYVRSMEMPLRCIDLRHVDIDVPLWYFTSIYESNYTEKDVTNKIKPIQPIKTLNNYRRDYFSSCAVHYYHDTYISILRVGSIWGMIIGIVAVYILPFTYYLIFN